MYSLCSLCIVVQVSVQNVPCTVEYIFIFGCMTSPRSPCKIQCTFYCHCVVKIIPHLFVNVGPQPLGSKRPQRTQLSDGVGCYFCFFWFSSRKFSEYPEKVDIMPFFGAVNSSALRLHAYCS